MIVWSIEDALQAEEVTAVFVSTDDADIRSVSREAGARVIDRPAELAGDTASSESALLHALDVIENDHGIVPELIVFLQATCPIRCGGDIDSAVKTLRDRGADSLLSVVPSHTFLWKDVNGEAVPCLHDKGERPRRQDMDPVYRENGSIYVTRSQILRSTGDRLGGHSILFPMEEQAGIDIDTALDFHIAASWLNKLEANPHDH